MAKQAKRQLAGSGEALPAGAVGEVVKTSATAQTISSAGNVVTNHASITIGPGTWILSGHFLGVPSGNTNGAMIITDGGPTSSVQLSGYSSSTQILAKRDGDSVVGATMPAFVINNTSTSKPIYLNIFRGLTASFTSGEWSLTAIRIA
jgi:hypothetical protein